MNTLFDRLSSICLELGNSYRFGKDVEINLVEAVRYYTLAADYNNDVAQNILGCLYQTGEGVDQDLTKAVEYYQKSANQGNVLAQTNLGSLYYLGEGVDQDFK